MPNPISPATKESTRVGLLLSLPIVLGVALVFSDRWFTVIDDECAIVDRAAGSVVQTVQYFLHGLGLHEHPPLFDLILHGWLLLTGGRQSLLRLPSILFYVLGAWALAMAAKRLVGTRGQAWVLILVALWPYGFHFGRATAWYSLSFLLISLLTWSYFLWLDQPSFVHWILLFLCSLCLVYSNYFGWALLACLAIDLVLRKGREFLLLRWQILGMALLLLVAYLPIFAAFLREIDLGVHTGSSALTTLLYAGYNLFCIFVSESVAPWFWGFGVLGVLAIAACLLLTILHCPPQGRRFLLYFAGLFLIMMLLGILSTKRLMLLGPWLILPVGITLGTLPRSFTRRALLTSLAITAGIGWYGTFARNLYAAPRWTEPWETVAEQAAVTVQEGGLAIANNASFFFYLTYLLPENSGAPGAHFSGLMPTSVHRPDVYSPDQWIDAGQPKKPTMLLIKGMHLAISDTSTETIEDTLNRNCHLQSDRKMAYDPGAKWKQRYAPQLGELDWRVEVLTYSCPER